MLSRVFKQKNIFFTIFLAVVLLAIGYFFFASQGQAPVAESQACGELFDSCSIGSNCCSGVCSYGWCYCRDDGVSCSNNEQCCAGFCNTSNLCANPLKDNGVSCGSGSECSSGLCSGGLCVACLANGASCPGNNQCCSGNCNSDVCGVCSAQGNSCFQNSNCCAGLLCGGAYGENWNVCRTPAELTDPERRIQGNITEYNCPSSDYHFLFKSNYEDCVCSAGPAVSRSSTRYSCLNCSTGEIRDFESNPGSPYLCQAFCATTEIIAAGGCAGGFSNCFKTISGPCLSEPPTSPPAIECSLRANPSMGEPTLNTNLLATIINLDGLTFNRWQLEYGDGLWNCPAGGCLESSYPIDGRIFPYSYPLAGYFEAKLSFYNGAERVNGGCQAQINVLRRPQNLRHISNSPGQIVWLWDPEPWAERYRIYTHPYDISGDTIDPSFWEFTSLPPYSPTTANTFSQQYFVKKSLFGGSWESLSTWDFNMKNNIAVKACRGDIFNEVCSPLATAEAATSIEAPDMLSCSSIAVNSFTVNVNSNERSRNAAARGFSYLNIGAWGADNQSRVFAKVEKSGSLVAGTSWLINPANDGTPYLTPSLWSVNGLTSNTTYQVCMKSQNQDSDLGTVGDFRPQSIWDCPYNKVGDWCCINCATLPACDLTACAGFSGSDYASCSGCGSDIQLGSTATNCSGQGGVCYCCKNPPGSLGQIRVAHPSEPGGIVKLNLIDVATASAKPNMGLIKVVIGDGSIAAADLVLTSDLMASPVRVMTVFGVRAWRKAP